MADIVTPTGATDPGKPPGRSRGPLIVLAVGAVPILIIGITSFAVLGGDKSPAITGQPSTTTAAPTTTAAASTTIASLQSPFPPDTPPMDIVAAIRAAWEVGDVEAAEALIHPHSSYFGEGTDVSHEVWYRYATGVTTESQCVEGVPAELADISPGGVMVTCEDVLVSGLRPGEIIGGGIVAYDVGDGWVLDLSIVPGYVGAENEFGSPQWNQYRLWLERRDPENLDHLYVPAVGPSISTPEARDQHRELVPFFVADTG